METVEALATCPEDTMDILSQEIEALGGVVTSKGHKAVYFEADKTTFYECHLRLSTASSILQVVKSFSAQDLKELAKRSQYIRWYQILNPKKTFRVDVVLTEKGKDLPRSNDVSKVVRRTIENSFKKSPPPKVELKDTDVIVVVHYNRKNTTISLKTSGDALHKRGYRISGHPAPLKETVASTILRLSGYDGSKHFLDPMCGSGTLGIEASYLALGKATPLILEGLSSSLSLSVIFL